MIVQHDRDPNLFFDWERGAVLLSPMFKMILTGRQRKISSKSLPSIFVRQNQEIFARFYSSLDHVEKKTKSCTNFTLKTCWKRLFPSFLQKMRLGHLNSVSSPDRYAAELHKVLWLSIPPNQQLFEPASVVPRHILMLLAYSRGTRLAFYQRRRLRQLADYFLAWIAWNELIFYQCFLAVRNPWCCLSWTLWVWRLETWLFYEKKEASTSVWTISKIHLIDASQLVEKAVVL